MRAWRALTRGLAALVGWRGFTPTVWLACAVPLALVAWPFWLAFTGRDPMALGVDPNKTLLHETGENALALLLLSLTITPVRRLFGIQKIQGIRRMVGLWAFAYAAVHLAIYLVFDQLCYSARTCDLPAIWQDILKRRFIVVGQLGFGVLLALALTSTRGWMRRLGRNWSRLHRLAYLAGVAGVIHFVWVQKSSYEEPLRWAAWLGVLLLVRLYFWLAGRRTGLPQL